MLINHRDIYLYTDASPLNIETFPYTIETCPLYFLLTIATILVFFSGSIRSLFRPTSLMPGRVIQRLGVIFPIVFVRRFRLPSPKVKAQLLVARTDF